jgi:malate/lactate dehydrogenase
MEALEKRIDNAAFEIIAAKADSGSATLAVAYAASSFCHALGEARTGTRVKE